jgi:hypothetical protein
MERGALSDALIREGVFPASVRRRLVAAGVDLSLLAVVGFRGLSRWLRTPSLLGRRVGGGVIPGADCFGFGGFARRTANL